MKRFLSLPLIIVLLAGCNNENTSEDNGNSPGKGASADDFKEGRDYEVYDRVRLYDKTGFSEPQEAYSMLLPKGWTHQDRVIWNQPGSSCAGTFREMKAQSADGNYSFEMFPDVIYSWNTNPELRQFYQNMESSSTCAFREPPQNAEAYLRDVFVKEIGNPEISDVKTNQHVVNQMQQSNEKSMREMQQYGAGQMQFHQTAINAEATWPDGTAGWIVLGVSIAETTVPNIYDGSSSKIFTTLITNRVVYKYPKEEKETATNQFSFVMASIRTNPSWNESVNSYWKDVRQQKHVAHVGRIRMMDEQTRQMGEDAIRRGQQRLNDMDNEMRSWEQKQASQDRIHTNFIKTIREVENYRDETGKIELSSGYNHAWSRSDGSSFILSNNPNFDPSSIFQDARWKEMKKVD